jgi:hypothetical protein
MMAMKRGSVDVTALYDFETNFDSPRFDKWYTEKPAAEWEGVVQASPHNHILEIDFATLDPLLQVRHPSVLPSSRPPVLPSSRPSFL